MKNFGSELAKGAGAEADKQGKGVGKKFGTAMLAGVAVVAGGAALATKALYGIGETFDEVSDTIRVGTGATGDALDALTESAKRIGTKVPAEFEAIGTVVADVNTRLGLTGPTLEKFSSQVLEAGRIMGEEIDINALSGAFNAFRIEGEDTTEAMDHLFRVSQATGVGMNELATNAATAAPAMQALGFSFEDTTALVGNLDKAGLNSSKMMAGMSRALVELAKDGEEPQDAFKRVTGEIQAFMEEGDKASAIDLASQLFGTRNASQFIGALESGALAMDDLGSVAGMTEDTILGAGKETMDFAEQWRIFKNQVLVALEPIASRVFKVLSDGMQWVNDKGIPYARALWESFKTGEGTLAGARAVFDTLWGVLVGVGGFVTGTLVPALSSLWGWVGKNKDLVVALGGAVLGYTAYLVAMNAATIASTVATKAASVATQVWTAVQKALNLVLKANPIGILIAAITALVAVVIYAYRENETFRKIVERVWTGIKSAISAVVSWFRNTAWPWMRDALQWIGDKASWLWNGAMRPAWDNILAKVKAVGGWVKNTLWPWVRDAFENIATKAGNIKDRVVRAWDSIKGGISSGWDTIKGIFDKFKGGLDSLKSKFSSVKSGITQIWGTIGAAIAKPINKVIDAVNNFTKNLAEKLSKIPGVSISIPTIPHVPVPGPPPQGGYAGGYRPGSYADGGLIPGPWMGPRADNVLGVSDAGVPVARVNPREFITRVASTMKMRRQFPGWLEHINRHGRPPGYADGGMVGGQGGSLGDALVGGGQFMWDLFKSPTKALKAIADKALGGLADSLPFQVVKGVTGDAISKLVTWVKEKLFGGEDGSVPRPVGPAMGWQSIWGLVKGLWPDAILTSAVRNSTVAGYGGKSLHASGRAIDFVLNPWSRMVGATKVLSQLKGWTELIHTPAGRWQQSFGKSFTNWLPITKAQHHNHVHVGMADGGLVKPFVADAGALLRPGLNLLDNRTGGPEPLGRLDQPLDLSVDTISDLRREFKVMLDDNRRALVRELVTAGRAG